MRYPDFLKTGETIGFAAPSFGAAMEPYHTAFQHALNRFESLGMKTLLGPNVYKNDGIGISTDPRACGEELTEVYCAPQVRALISVGGGELMCETLDHVNFEKIRLAAPKWFMGYSDNTNFGFLLATLCDVASIYGPCAASFGMEPWHPAIQDAFDLVTGKNLTVHTYDQWEKNSVKDADHPLAPYALSEPTVIRSFGWDGQPFSGRLLGGCLDVLCNLSGTSYDHVAEFGEKYREDGIIWFIEACDLNVFGIRRALWQLKRTGWFRHVKGFLIGRPYNMGQELMGLDQYDAVLAMLKEFGVPILMDLDIGHLAPMMPLINGGYGTVEKTGKGIEIRFETK